MEENNKTFHQGYGSYPQHIDKKGVIHVDYNTIQTVKDILNSKPRIYCAMKNNRRGYIFNDGLVIKKEISNGTDENPEIEVLSKTEQGLAELIQELSLPLSK